MRQFNLSNDTVEGLLGRIKALSDTIKTTEQTQQYLKKQPQPRAKSYFDEILNSVLSPNRKVHYIRIPPALLERMKTELDPASYLHHIDSV
jgi:hypothetical protein